MKTGIILVVVVVLIVVVAMTAKKKPQNIFGGNSPAPNPIGDFVETIVNSAGQIISRTPKPSSDGTYHSALGPIGFFEGGMQWGCK